MVEFMDAMERAYFFFGDDVGSYLKQLCSDILDVRTAGAELPATNDSEARQAILEKRRAALNRIGNFTVSDSRYSHRSGQAIGHDLRLRRTPPVLTWLADISRK
jgi:hypothetical protein